MAFPQRALCFGPISCVGRPEALAAKTWLRRRGLSPRTISEPDWAVASKTRIWRKQASERKWQWPIPITHLSGIQSTRRQKLSLGDGPSTTRTRFSRSRAKHDLRSMLSHSRRKQSGHACATVNGIGYAPHTAIAVTNADRRNDRHRTTPSAGGLKWLIGRSKPEPDESAVRLVPPISDIRKHGRSIARPIMNCV